MHISFEKQVMIFIHLYTYIFLKESLGMHWLKHMKCIKQRMKFVRLFQSELLEMNRSGFGKNNVYEASPLRSFETSYNFRCLTKNLYCTIFRRNVCIQSLCPPAEILDDDREKSGTAQEF